MPSLLQPGLVARHRVLSYGAAIVFVLAALGVRLVFWPAMGEGVPYSFFFLAVVGAATYGGVGPAILATILSGLLVDYFLLPPLHSFSGHDAREFAGLGVFVIVCLAITMLAARQRRSAALLAVSLAEQKLAEKALIRSEKLASAGRLAASIAHEINNPLEAVTNLLFLARRDPSLAAESQRYLELADAELRRVAHIARQTLGFYRESTAPLCFRPPELVENVVELLGQKIDAKRIQITREYRCRDEILGLAGEFRQVISNLLTNALDALPQGGAIRLRITRAHDRHQRPGVRIAVADTGQGIAPEHRSQIFEPFFTTKEHAGTGLGLWVTREIVAKHGGTIRVRSKAGKGTVFTVFLPCEPVFPGIEPPRAQILAGDS